MKASDGGENDVEAVLGTGDVIALADKHSIEPSEPPPLPPKTNRSSLKIDEELPLSGRCDTDATANTLKPAQTCTNYEPAAGVTDSDSGIAVLDSLTSLDNNGLGLQHSPQIDGDINDVTLVANADSGCDVSNTLLVEKYDNVQDDISAETENIPLKNNEATATNEADNYEVAIVKHESSDARTSWNQLLESKDEERRKKAAVRCLGLTNAHEETSPFGYKSWLLRLSRRHRLEILIALGLFLWIGFFVVLAVCMNGDSTITSEPSGSISTSGHSPVKPNLAVEKIINITLTMNSTISNAEERRTTTTPHLHATAENMDMTNSKIGYGVTIGHTTMQPDILNTTNRSISAEQSTKNGSFVFKIRNNPTASSQASNLTEPKTVKVDKASSTPTPNQATTEHFTTPSSAPKTHKEIRTSSSVPSSTSNPSSTPESLPTYRIGIGRADITGPAADVNMMGYANPSQVAGGVHMRQFSRSFIIEQGRSRVLFINIDACMGSMLVKLEVLKVLKTMYGSLYNAENVCISGTHTHSAPAGFLQDVLFQITSKGYVEETLKAMVDGIVESVRIAHDKIAPGTILINKGELLDSNINRSPLAYTNNPESERKRYMYNVDKEMTLLKFLDANGKAIGMINWFPVHCTSMNNSNSLISGDNKGYAELLFEQHMDPGTHFGESSFIAAFAQSNEGDVSPNTRGPHCVDTGLPCDNIDSTCNGKVQNCIASGPGKDMFESTKIIGKNQYIKALELFEKAKEQISGPVKSIHQYIDMTNQVVTVNSTHTAHTCKPAMGFSFAAGTTDGPGAFDFKQGDKSGNIFWKTVRNFLHSPSKEQADCHYPKPILLDTGEMNYPYSWQPDVVDTQIFQIGQLIITAVPGEFSTMSGRRLREAVLEVYQKSDPSKQYENVIAGLSNTYSDYITTFEEYHVQRYEGASTVYGPYTLSAYIQQYKKLATALIQNMPLQGGAKAHDMKDKLMSFLTRVIMDTSPFGYSIGDVIIQAEDSYKVGDTVSVQFVSGNPRNSPTFNMTFLTVEREMDNGSWVIFLKDSAWDTKFIWGRGATFASVRGTSEATIKWDISPATPPGRYRINHYGHYKWWMGGYIYPYHGQSKIFEVRPADSNS